MLKYFVTLFLIAGGITASHICADDNDGQPPFFNGCEHPPATSGVPETNEELQKFCKPTIKFMECSIHYAETCGNQDPDFLEGAYRILATLRDVCSEDTLLHAVVVDNLKCYGRLGKDDVDQCYYGGQEAHNVEKFATALIEEGLVLPTDNENATNKLYQCIASMNFFACQSLVVERECGDVAADAYIQIVEKARPAFVEGCAESYQYLPVIIRLRRAEEEKERSIAEAFRKRK